MDFQQFDDKARKAAMDSSESFDMDLMWSKVEPLIKKEDKKRRVFLFFLFGFSVVLLSTFLLFTNGGAEKQVIEATNHDSKVEKKSEIGGFRNAEGELSHQKSANDQGNQSTDVSNDTPMSSASISGTGERPVSISHGELVSGISSIKTIGSTSSTVEEVLGEAKSGSLEIIQNSTSNSVRNSSQNIAAISVANNLDINSVIVASEAKEESLKSSVLLADRFPLIIGSLPSVVIARLISNESIVLARPFSPSTSNRLRKATWIGVSAGYYLNQRKFVNPDAFNPSDFDRRSTTERPLDAMSLNAHYRREFTDNWSWSVGLAYTSIWDKRADSFILDTISTSFAFNDYVTYRTVDRYLNYSSLGVPINIHWETASSKLMVLLSIGVETTLFNMRKGLIWYDDGEYDINTDTKSLYNNGLNITGLGGIGLGYSFDDRFSLLLNLTGRLPFTNMYNDTYNFTDKHTLYGGQLGLQYKL